MCVGLVVVVYIGGVGFGVGMCGVVGMFWFFV